MDAIKLVKFIFPTVFAIAGSFMVFMAIREGAKPYKLLKYGAETEGVVIEMYKRPMRAMEKTNGSFAPVVQFVTDKSILTTYYSTTFTNFNNFKLGQKVKIWYDASNPQLATLEGKDNWILAVAFGIFGAGICLIFYPMFFKQLLALIRN